MAGALPSVDQLFDDLKDERSHGYFVDEQRTATGMTSFSAPIVVAPGNRPIAAVSIAARSAGLSRGRREELGRSAELIAFEWSSWRGDLSEGVPLPEPCPA